MPNIKIWSTHSVGSKNIVLENNIFKAVRGGAFRETVHTMQPDCEGDNISEKNSSYCELTTQYWAWKNCDADYYGFCHYRRMMAFADEKFALDNWSVIYTDYITDAVLDRFAIIDEKQIEKVVSEFDVIAPIPSYMKKNGFKDVYDQYKQCSKLNIDDIDLTLQIIKEIKPDFYDSAIEYFSGEEGYFYNMFVMKKNLFNEYCEFLFSVLQEYENRKDISNYCVEGYRTPGHIGERLFGVFLTYLKAQQRYKIGYKPIVFFSHTEDQKELLPAFSDNNIPIVFSGSEFYMKFISATMLSLIENSSENYNYDIIILGKNFSKNSRNRLLSLVEEKKNISLRFYDVGKLFASYNLYETSHIGIETYYRLIMPEVFSHYEKMLYFDGDLIILDDVAKLYSIDIGNNYIGAVQDMVYKALVNGAEKGYNEYYKSFGCKNPQNFVNAGVLVMNTKKIRADFSMRFLLDLAQQGQFRFQDQDLLNIICENHVYFLDYKWNYFADALQDVDWIGSYAPHADYKEYIHAKEDISILHFAGQRKPWWNPNMCAGDTFWQYFRKSPFYESFLTQRMVDYSIAVYDDKLKKYNGGETKNSRSKPKFLRLLPKGTRRREIVKKIVCFLQGKKYVEPNYELEGIVVKYKKKNNNKRREE